MPRPLDKPPLTPEQQALVDALFIRIKAEFAADLEELFRRVLSEQGTVQKGPVDPQRDLRYLPGPQVAEIIGLNERQFKRACTEGPYAEQLRNLALKKSRPWRYPVNKTFLLLRSKGDDR